MNYASVSAHFTAHTFRQTESCTKRLRLKQYDAKLLILAEHQNKTEKKIIRTIKYQLEPRRVQQRCSMLNSLGGSKFCANVKIDTNLGGPSTARVAVALG